MSNTALTSYGVLQAQNVLDWAKAQTRNGAFSVAPGCTGVPDTAAWYAGSLLVNVPGSAWTLYLFNTTTREAICNFTVSGEWNGWISIATATKPQEFNLPLADGWLSIDARYEAVYWKTQESIVNISLGLKSDHTVTNGETIAILPSGFSPKKSLKIPITAVNQNGLLVHGYVDINRPDGTIQIYKITDQIRELCFPTTNFLANG